MGLWVRKFNWCKLLLASPLIWCLQKSSRVAEKPWPASNVWHWYLPWCSTWKGLTSTSNITATGICCFQNTLASQNTFKLHTDTNGYCMGFDFFEVQSSHKVHETCHTNFKCWLLGGYFFFLLKQKKRKEEEQQKNQQNRVPYSYTIALKQTDLIKWKSFWRIPWRR